MVLSERFRSLERLMRESEDESWRMSTRPLARGTTAFVSETIRDAGTLGEAMRRIARGYNIVHGGDFNHVELRPDRVVYRIDDHDFPFGAHVTAEEARTMMESVLVFVHAMLSLACRVDLRRHLRCVRVRGSAPSGPDNPLGYWAAPVRFGATAYELEFAPASAALPVAADRAGFGAVEVWAHAIELAEDDAGPASNRIADRVRAALSDGAEDQAQVARRLGVSVATLRRRLEQDGCRFRALRAEVLNARARDLLDQRRRAVDVAEALGFSDRRSFARAFRSWNGITPKEYVA